MNLPLWIGPPSKKILDPALCMADLLGDWDGWNDEVINYLIVINYSVSLNITAVLRIAVWQEHWRCINWCPKDNIQTYLFHIEIKDCLNMVRVTEWLKALILSPSSYKYIDGEHWLRWSHFSCSHWPHRRISQERVISYKSYKSRRSNKETILMENECKNTSSNAKQRLTKPSQNLPHHTTPGWQDPHLATWWFILYSTDLEWTLIVLINRLTASETYMRWNIFDGSKYIQHVRICDRD